ncbi:hypothetical protein WA158_000596 [Blastocystis sp. Blastoise]
MKVRTVTAFVYISKEDSLDVIREILETASANNVHAKSVFEKEGYEVQTLRITTNSFEDYCENDREAILNKMEELAKIVNDIEVSYFSLGNAKTILGMSVIPDILKMCSKFSLCATIDEDFCNIEDSFSICGHNVIRLSKETEQGLGNFNYTVCCCCKSFIPFFPASFSSPMQGFGGKTMYFGIGTENGDEVVQCFQKCHSFCEGKYKLLMKLNEEYKSIETIASSLSSSTYIYKGIDTSFNPGLSNERSIVEGIEQLCISSYTLPSSFSFGDVGSLSICRLLTSICDDIHVKKTGYCGLMLPVLEDSKLAQRYGIDTLPLPIDTSLFSIIMTYKDVYALSKKWNKQLSCRLFLCPDIHDGEISKFENPNLTNCIVHAI